MTVETFTPNKTTTLETPVRILQDSPVQKSKGTRIGFVSLGCPKNLVDSERILTQLRTEGYDVVPTYKDSDLVIVNTCGFIDSAVQESLDTIGEAIAENGKVIVNPGTSEVDLINKTVSYDLTQPNAYAWDGCTPKRLFFWVALIGTPDWWHGEHKIQAINEQGELVDKKVFWQLCMHASLIHDALYQYLDNIPLSKIAVDQLFYDMLLEAGMPKLLARVYYFVVQKFGASDVLPNDVSLNSDLKCETFKQLITT